ncbi:MAG: uracil-DNA glycosylase [Acidobacteriaceae bacterium]|nr:uracil-DNA glycosylase [Acidobacteriaceae bacterium]MBV9309009.1 uracil-DNA glycosylase [Acidobacteriaceae bacterium]
MPDREWRSLNQQIIHCRLCPRLVEYREKIGIEKRRAFREQEYWSQPLTGFGDRNAKLLIIGLAPAAHGGNRTGRIFTGDRSADFLIRALWETGFANQPESRSKNDGLQLIDAYMTLPVRCAPPDNKPTRGEILTCRPYLLRELALLKNIQIVVPLGAIAFNAYLAILKSQGFISSRAAFRFAHGALFSTHEGGPRVLASYHPSQQNTSTGRLTAAMLRDIFSEAKRLLGAAKT